MAIATCGQLRGDGEELETLPFALKRDEDLESFCLRSIARIRMDG